MSSSLTDSLKMAMQLHGARRLAEAEAIYRQILLQYPREPFVTHLLGTLEMQAGRIEPAIVHLEMALSYPTARFEWHQAAVDCNVAAGLLERAVHWQQKMISVRPAWPDGYVRLAELFAGLGRYDEAASSLKRAIDLGPGDPAICHNNLGATYDRLGRVADAVPEYRRAIAIRPEYAVAHRNLGDALRQLRDLPAAEISYRDAVRYDPSLGDAYNGIGLTLYLRERFTEAIEQFRIAMRLSPTDTNPCINLVLCYGRLGDHEQIERILRHTLEISPNDARTRSTLVMLMNYTRGHELPAVLTESLEFNRRHAEPVAAGLDAGSSALKVRQTNRPLRIGYISPDFRHHPVAIFLQPLLKNHDRSRFTLFCYADVATPDAFTEKFKTIADVWRDITGRSDEEAAGQIRADEIDILIDLAGHTVDNRMLTLARKPAPVQATWLGYPNTTGIAAIDYRITDIWADPIGTEKYYTEKLIRLPGAFFVYQPPEKNIAVSSLPMLENGYVTFGSFNNITKITPAIGRWWSEILRRVPGSKLLIAGIPSDATQRILSTIVAPEVSAERIEFPQAIGFEALLKLHHRVDIALDAFPYTGHTTTCNSLWMGVPVVSLAGPTAVSRSGASIMANLGLSDDWVATNEQDYIQLAVKWANQSDQLKTLRATLRDKLQSSNLTDARSFAANFENTLQMLVDHELSATV